MKTSSRRTALRQMGTTLAFAAASGLPAAALAQDNRDEELAAKTRAGTLVLDEVIEIEERLGTDEWRAAKLGASSRRRRDVTLEHGGRKIGGMVVWPDRPGPAPVVIVIPEDQGLNRWGRLIADQIAAMGYIVVAPDFMFGLAPNGGGGSDFPDVRSVFLAHRATKRDQDQMTADLNAWADFGLKLPEANGKLGVVGFAWGGGRAFRFATQRKDLAIACIFYDAAPPPELLAGLTAPVHGFYAEHDPRVTRSLATTKEAMARLGKTYEPVMYPGSEHMFVRLGEEPRNKLPANMLAREQALARLQTLLARI